MQKIAALWKKCFLFTSFIPFNLLHLLRISSGEQKISLDIQRTFFVQPYFINKRFSRYHLSHFLPIVSLWI